MKIAALGCVALVATTVWAQQENITVLWPDASTLYRHGEVVEGDWSPAYNDGRTIRADLYKGGVFVAEYHALTDNDGHFARDACPSEWGWGNDFQIKIIHDPTGDFGWSESFTIVGGTGSNGGVEVLTPNSDSVLHHGAPAPGEWLPALNDGRTIVARLYKAGQFVDTYHNPTHNDGAFQRDSCPPSWGTGVDYQVQMIHMPTGDYGWSDPFTIAGDGMESIEVLWPMHYTELRYGEPAACDWAPALHDGRTIRVELYKGGSLVDDYHLETDNDGHCMRDSVPCDWGSGTDFQVKVIHEPTGDYGWSESFAIWAPGDYNKDGTINTMDVLAFLNAWTAGCP